MELIGVSIVILYRLIVIQLVILGLFGLYLILKRRKDMKDREKISLSKKRLLPLWINFFNNKIEFIDDMIPKDLYEIQAIEEIFVAYLNNISNPDIFEKIKRFANHYLIDHYRWMLKSKRWSIRMNALYRMIDFEMVRLRNDLKRMEERPWSSEERFLILKYFSRFDEERFLKRVIQSSFTFSDYEYKKLLMDSDYDVLEKLINRFDELTSIFKYSLIDVFGFRRELEALPFLEKNLQSVDPEIRIRTLRAIHEIGVIQKPNMYLSFADSPYWEERLMAARLFKYVTNSIASPYLEKLIADPVWQVRSQAVRTLAGRKLGKEKLEQLMSSSADPSIKDLASEVLWEGVR